jgi:hypothetical protein
MDLQKGHPMIGIFFAVVIVGVIVYLVESMIPMPPPIRVVVRIVGVLVIVILLLRLVGVVLP